VKIGKGRLWTTEGIIKFLKVRLELKLVCECYVVEVMHFAECTLICCRLFLGKVNCENFNLVLILILILYVTSCEYHASNK